MAALVPRFSQLSRSFSTTTRLLCSKMSDPLEHSTGLEKRELLAHVAGNDRTDSHHFPEQVVTISSHEPNPSLVGRSSALQEQEERAQASGYSLL